MSSINFFQNNQEFLLAMSIVQISHPELWAKLESSNILTKLASRNKTGNVVSKHGQTYSNTFGIKELEYFDKWCELVQGKRISTEYVCGIINLGTNLNERIHWILSDIIPFVLENISLVNDFYIDEVGVKTYSIVKRLWTLTDEVKNNVMFYMFILHYIKTNPTVITDFLRLQFNFKKKNQHVASWHNIALLYDMLPVSIGVFELIELKYIDASIDTNKFISDSLDYLIYYLVYWIEAEFNTSSQTRESPRWSFYFNYLKNKQVTAKSTWKRISINIEIEDIKIFTKIYLSKICPYLTRLYNDEFLLKKSLLMIQTCVIIIDDPDLDFCVFI